MSKKTTGKSASKEAPPRSAKAKREAKGPNSDEKGTDGSDTDDTDPFDFGGLPIRDLKKNLGCG